MASARGRKKSIEQTRSKVTHNGQILEKQTLS